MRLLPLVLPLSLPACAAVEPPPSVEDQAVSTSFRYTYTQIASGPYADNIARAQHGALLWGSLSGRHYWNGTSFEQLSSTPDDATKVGVYDPSSGTTYLVQAWIAQDGHRYGVPDGTYVTEVVPWRAEAPLYWASQVAASRGARIYFWDSHRERVCRVHPTGLDCLEGTAWQQVSDVGSGGFVASYDDARRTLVVFDKFPSLREYDSAANTWHTVDASIAGRAATAQPRSCADSFFDSDRGVTVAFCGLPGPNGGTRVIEWDGHVAHDGEVVVTPAGRGHAFYDPNLQASLFTYAGRLYRSSREEITTTNTPPTLAETRFTTYATETMAVRLAPTDAEGAPVTIALVDGPTGLELDGDTLRWAPAVTDAGVHPVHLRLGDGTDEVDRTVELEVIAHTYQGLPATIDRTVEMTMSGLGTFAGGQRGVHGGATCRLVGTNPGVIRTECAVELEFCSAWTPSVPCANVSVGSWHQQGVLSPQLGISMHASESSMCSSCTPWNGELHALVDVAGGRVCGDQRYQRQVHSDPILATAESTADGCGAW